MARNRVLATTVTGTIIRAMVRRIVTRFKPEKVILFGSHARGTAGPDSDVDLLVVMPCAHGKREAQVALRLALRDFAVPKDIIVSSPEEFAWRQHVPGTLEYPAVLEGKLLHGTA
jgi:predicted nucleotidyltransferase